MSVIYVLTVEEKWVSQRTLGILGWVCGVGAVALAAFYTMPNSGLAEAWFLPWRARDWPFSLYPLVIGANYALLLLAALWGGRALRFLFELAPLRFIGLISYSLYLWHVPVLGSMLPGTSSIPYKVLLPLTVPVAYLSYQLVERPFLKRRRATTARPATTRRPQPTATPTATPVDTEPVVAIHHG